MRLRAAYAFDFLDQEVLQTTTDQENGAARRVLEKAGYQRTGWQPHYIRVAGAAGATWTCMR